MVVMAKTIAVLVQEAETMVVVAVENMAATRRWEMGLLLLLLLMAAAAIHHGRPLCGSHATGHAPLPSELPLMMSLLGEKQRHLERPFPHPTHHPLFCNTHQGAGRKDNTTTTFCRAQSSTSRPPSK